MSASDKLIIIAENMPKVHEAGKKSGQDEIWNGIVEEKSNYTFAFLGWQMAYMRPPTKIIPITSDSFNQTFRGNSKLKIIESDYFDFSQKKEGTTAQTSYYYTFYDCRALEKVEDVGIGTVYPIYQFGRTFFNCYLINTIEKITVAETTKFANVFDYCHRLTNITFDGVIGQSGLDFHWSSLSKASIENIINHLSLTATGKSITLPKAAINTAFNINLDDETTYPEGSEYYVLRHSKDNWTINYS